VKYWITYVAWQMSIMGFAYISGRALGLLK
jgi:hypothetical protein